MRCRGPWAWWTQHQARRRRWARCLMRYASPPPIPPPNRPRRRSLRRNVPQCRQSTIDAACSTGIPGEFAAWVAPALQARVAYLRSDHAGALQVLVDASPCVALLGAATTPPLTALAAQAPVLAVDRSAVAGAAGVRARAGLALRRPSGARWLRACRPRQDANSFAALAPRPAAGKRIRATWCARAAVPSAAQRPPLTLRVCFAGKMRAGHQEAVHHLLQRQVGRLRLLAPAGQPLPHRAVVQSLLSAGQLAPGQVPRAERVQPALPRPPQLSQGTPRAPAQRPPRLAAPAPDPRLPRQVAYRYFHGRLLLFQEKHVESADALMAALRECPTSCPRNKRCAGRSCTCALSGLRSPVTRAACIPSQPHSGVPRSRQNAGRLPS